MMDDANLVGHRPEENGREMIYSLYSAPPEQARSPSMDFTWAHPIANGLHNPRQTLATESWVSRTDVDPSMSSNYDFRNEFELENNPVNSGLFSFDRSMGPPIDSSSPLDRADCAPSEQGFSPQDYFPDSIEARDMTSDDHSPDSSPSARRTASTAATTPMESAPGMTDLKQHRERNRVAARKCRQKAKQNFTSLQRREKELSQKNKALHNHVGGLRDEILDLKNEILRHSGCNSSVIQNYIANAARSPIRMRGPTQPLRESAKDAYAKE
ncbi:hypothetical protein NPX13_g4017 [Xylaria arbuscula]|uniref:BZIP domain-containing protein n=1 Tax=Xylaria arbuscula TaxID=114810 RepID=A0A9W8TMM7_9PEZI|nr:hypothetical protein NPX13_g4017 [Xylaria arbuscula]